MKRIFTALVLLCFALSLSAQSIIVTSGSLDFLRGEKVFYFTYTYNDMTVGKMTESEYVKKKKSEYNEKEPGRGDKWEQAWIDDRQNRFEPKFEELFMKQLEKKNIYLGKDQANYRFVFNTDFTEPGYNVGVWRGNAFIDLTCTIVNVASGEQVATIKIRKSPGRDALGADFDTGFRIQEGYAKAGKEFAKFLLKKVKL